jgi:hypothetical protein
MMRANHLTYNDAVQLTERQELLLNIVRLRYNEGPEFLATSSISTQYVLDLSAGAGGVVGDDQELRTELFDFNGGIGYSERPTITFTPQNAQEFTRQLISPIELEIIYLLVNYGWDIDRVLRMMVNGMNELRNDTLREDPTAIYADRLQAFTDTVETMRDLQKKGMIELTFEEETTGISGPIHADRVNLSEILKANENGRRLDYDAATKSYRLVRIDRHLILRISREAKRQPALQKIIRHLKLDPAVSAYRLRHAPGSRIKASENPNTTTDLMLSTRSVLATMAYLSQGVSVPDRHVSSGVVTHSTEGFDSRGSIRDLFNIKVQPEKPRQAGLAVPFKGYWFYVRDNDISSRRTLGVLNSMVRLKIQATTSQNKPVLTLPVSR